MTRPKLCVSVFGSTLESLEKNILEASKYRPDLIEIRLDYLQGLDLRTLDLASKFFKEKSRILTIRSRLEGGKFKGPEEERLDLLTHAIRFQPYLVDIEIETIRKNPGILQVLNKTRLIASFHDFSGTKKARLKERASFKVQNHLFAIKVVSKANTLSDNLRILSLYETNSYSKNSKLVAFCIGKFGVSSRILSLLLGSPFGYAALPGRPTAEGQLDVETMKRIVRAK